MRITRKDHELGDKGLRYGITVWQLVVKVQ